MSSLVQKLLDHTSPVLASHPCLHSPHANDAALCYAAYFDTVHPVYPFLCPDTFRARALGQNLTQSLTADKSWAALFYTIVAIGCQNNDGGSFEAGVGEAWSYFERSLSYFQDLLFGRGSLTAVQVRLLSSHCE